jgi:hypothetical protein
MGALNRVLNWADRRGRWWVVLAGVLIACIAWAFPDGGWVLWLLTAAGLVMTAIRPFGTQQRRRVLIRQAWRRLNEVRADVEARARTAHDMGLAGQDEPGRGQDNG